jgi:hypothetical protein
MARPKAENKNIKLHVLDRHARLCFQSVLLLSRLDERSSNKQVRFKIKNTFMTRLNCISLLALIHSIPKDYRWFVYCSAIRHGSQEEWELASREYDREIDGNSKRALQYGMSCTREPWLIARYLNDQLNEKKVRRQDCLAGLRYAMIHSHSNKIAWVFLKNNWNLLLEGSAAFKLCL